MLIGYLRLFFLKQYRVLLARKANRPSKIITNNYVLLVYLDYWAAIISMTKLECLERPLCFLIFAHFMPPLPSGDLNRRPRYGGPAKKNA